MVKLPRERVGELVAAGTGGPFAPARKVFREWVAVTTVDPELWRAVLAESVESAWQSLLADSWFPVV